MLFTVFTPTYNRAYILPKAYESLVNQDFQDFEWVIMDDGSSDNTKDLVDSWIAENKISINYLSQQNQGRFAAFNHAKSHFNGELMYPLDSDDYIPLGSLSLLAETWNSLKDKQSELSGIMGHCETNGNVLLGSEFPEGVFSEKLTTLYDKYGIQGDKIQVIKTTLIQKYDYPIFENEKFGGDRYVYNAICDEAPEYLLNKCICHREYHSDGLMNSIMKHHLLSPNGMREHYRDNLAHEFYNQKSILKHIVGFIAYSKITHRSLGYIIKNTPKKTRTILLLPIGHTYSIYLNQKRKDLLKGSFNK